MNFKSKLFNPKAESKFESLAPVAVEVFVHGDQVPQVIHDCRDALAQGLVPVSFALINNAVVLRLERNESRKPLQEEGAMDETTREYNRRYHLADRARCAC